MVQKAIEKDQQGDTMLERITYNKMTKKRFVLEHNENAFLNDETNLLIKKMSSMLGHMKYLKTLQASVHNSCKYY